MIFYPKNAKVSKFTMFWLFFFVEIDTVGRRSGRGWRIGVAHLVQGAKLEVAIQTYKKYGVKGHKTHSLELFFFNFLISFVFFLAFYDYERLNHQLLGDWQPNTLNVMILIIHLMLFQYYFFFSEFIALFMVWLPIHMYVIRF